MEIKIKLKNPKSCEGCPCVNNDDDYWYNCNLGYFKSLHNYKTFILGENSPKECIEKHGE